MKYIVFFICVFLLTSCGMLKKTTKSESDGVYAMEQFAKDSSIIEYFLDTTSRQETEVVFNRIEYFPTAVYDSASGQVVKRQAVKSVQSVVVHRTAEKKGKTEAKAEHTTVSKDSVKAEAKTISEKTTTKLDINYYLFFCILFLVIALYWVYRKLRQ